MKSLHTAILLSLSLASISVFADEKIVVGFVGALTGPQAHYGKDSERGILLAIDEINARHPTIAGKPVTFSLDAEDDAADPRTATLVAQRFVDQHVNAVIGHQNSGTSIAAANIYAAAHIAEITPSATNPQFTHLGFKTTFRMLANDSFLGEALAEYAVKQLHVRRVAVIDDRTAYGQGIADVFVAAMSKMGATVTSREYTTDKAFDFSSALTLIKSKQPDAIFFGGMDPQGGPLLKQMKKFHIDAPLLGGDAICDDGMKTLAGDALNGNLFCADGGRSFEKMPGGPAFEKRFKDRYGESVQIYAPYAYDAMMAIYGAVIKARSTDPAAIVDALHESNFAGVTGKIAFDANGDLKNPAATISTFKNGDKASLAEVIK